jgi:hypothetical protein
MKMLLARLFGRYQEGIDTKELRTTRVGGYWWRGKFYITKIEPNPQ